MVPCLQDPAESPDDTRAYLPFMDRSSPANPSTQRSHVCGIATYIDAAFDGLGTGAGVEVNLTAGAFVTELAGAGATPNLGATCSPPRPQSETRKTV